ncbi:hypothetical protein P7C73_g85, partial [Tremellales sp. Uapishka_1]
MPSRLTYIYIVVFLLVLTLITFAHQSTATEFTLPLLPSSYSYNSPNVQTNFTDAENRHLSQHECLVRYPELYVEADRANAYYAKRGGIKQSDVDEAEADGASARLVILDNKLFVKAFYGGINTRTQAAIAAVYGTLMTSPEPMPDVDFVIQTSDGGGGVHPHFVLCRKASQPELWLMPDFGFFAWPEPGVGSYSQVRAESLLFEETKLDLQLSSSDPSTIRHDSWEKKIKKLMWRGSPMVEVRQDLLRASKDQSWSDVQELNWGAVNQDQEGREKNNGDIKTPAEHCQWGFLAHVEGWAYSGRLKYLQQCRSVIVTHPLEYIQHYHHLLISSEKDPKQNIVEVPLPLEEHLPAAMEALLDPTNQERRERIVENSWRDMREGYISPAANECYYRYALRAYAEVQAFKPELGEGVPYESFLLMGTTKWDPHR